MVKKSIYLFVISLIFVSCDDSSSNINNTTGSGTGYGGILRQVSSVDAKSDEKIILTKIKDECGSEENGFMILSGDDIDLDGLLEYEEANGKSILCNGKNGQIVKSADENDDLIKALVSAKCQGANGLAFHIGYDRDGDNQLSETERALQPSIICDNRLTTFKIDYYDFYSTLTINDGADAKYVNFYYPKITALEKDDIYCADGGFRVEMFGENPATSQPKLDFNNTVCNGKDGDTPIILKIDGNETLNENGECQKTGGTKISLSGIDSFICNGGTGSFGGELNLSIRDSEDGNVYIFDGTNKVSEALNLAKFNIASNETLITKKASTIKCPYGELNISTYLDNNFNHSLDSQELSSLISEIVCSAEPISASALLVTSALLKSDTNLTINFGFNRLVNQVTVNQNSIALICSSQSEKDKDMLIDIDFEQNFDVDGVSDFNLTYTQATLPQPTNNIDCKLKISKFIEDVNGVSMQSSYKKDFNFSVQ